jgi:vitamin B12 transporter
LFYTIEKSTLFIKIHYQHIKTINTKLEGANLSALNKQLTYTPINKTSSSIGIQRSKFNLAAIFNYIDYRYTTTDNSKFLDPYYTIDATISKTIPLSSLTLKCYLQVNNITNESYQIIAYYPVPGRTFQLGLTINFNKPNKQTP